MRITFQREKARQFYDNRTLCCVIFSAKNTEWGFIVAKFPTFSPAENSLVRPWRGAAHLLFETVRFLFSTH